jgi:hypothetical protein
MNSVGKGISVTLTTLYDKTVFHALIYWLKYFSGFRYKYFFKAQNLLYKFRIPNSRLRRIPFFIFCAWPSKNLPVFSFYSKDGGSTLLLNLC